MPKEIKETPTLNDLKTLPGLFKIYRGVVEDNNSPKKDGRVRVRIFGLHTDDKKLIPTDTLPWAEVMQSLAFGYGSGTGITSVPRTGTWVFLILDEGNPNNPIVVGAVNGTYSESGDFQLPISGREKFNDVNDLANPGYPNNHVIETLGGHVIEIDDSGGNERIRICHTNGNEVLLNNAGISITSTKDITTTSAGKFTQTVLNTITINATGAIQINTSGSVNVSCQGDANVKANGNINATSANNINLKALANTNITTDGNTAVTTTGTTTVNSTGNMTAHTDGNLSVTAAGTGLVKSTGAMNVESGGALTLKSASNTMVI